MVLAEYTEFTGNFPAIAAQCLQKLPSSNNKFTYNCDHHTFNFLVEDGYGIADLFCCIFPSLSAGSTLSHLIGTHISLFFSFFWAFELVFLSGFSLLFGVPSKVLLFFFFISMLTLDMNKWMVRNGIWVLLVQLENKYGTNILWMFLGLDLGCHRNALVFAWPWRMKQLLSVPNVCA